MLSIRTLLLTAIAPAIWGGSYIVTTELLGNISPQAVALLRALPTGLLLLCFVKQLPKGWDIPKVLTLGILNISIFWMLLFFAAKKLPGGVASIVTALQPFFVIFASSFFLGSSIRMLTVFSIFMGIVGVSLLVFTPQSGLSMIGVVAGIGGSLSVGLGTVLSRKWKPEVSILTYTAWQLCAGGLVLIPFVIFFGEDWSGITVSNVLGLAYLGLLGGGVAFVLWLNGIMKLTPSSVSILSFISPVVASFLGWCLLNQSLGLLQLTGMLVLFLSIFVGQYSLFGSSLKD